MIHFLCPFCRKSLKARPADAGKSCKCNKCQLTVDIPGKPEVFEPETKPAKPEKADDPLELPVRVIESHHYALQFDCIPLIRFFLNLAIWLASIAMVMSVVFFIAMDAKPFERGFLIGYVVGGWIGFMVVIATAWLLTEVVLELRYLRNNRH